MINPTKMTDAVRGAANGADAATDAGRGVRRGADAAAQAAQNAGDGASGAMRGADAAAQTGQDAARNSNDFQIQRRPEDQEAAEFATPQPQEPAKLTRDNLSQLDTENNAGATPSFPPVGGDLPNVPEAPYTRGGLKELQNISDPNYIGTPEDVIPDAADGTEVKLSDIKGAPDERPLYKHDLTMREDPAFDPEIENMPLENVEGRGRPEALFSQNERASLGMDDAGSEIASQAEIPDASLSGVVTRQDIPEPLAPKASVHVSQEFGSDHTVTTVYPHSEPAPTDINPPSYDGGQSVRSQSDPLAGSSYPVLKEGSAPENSIPEGPSNGVGSQSVDEGFVDVTLDDIKDASAASMTRENAVNVDDMDISVSGGMTRENAVNLDDMDISVSVDQLPVRNPWAGQMRGPDGKRHPNYDTIKVDPQSAQLPDITEGVLPTPQTSVASSDLGSIRSAPADLGQGPVTFAQADNLIDFDYGTGIGVDPFVDLPVGSSGESTSLSDLGGGSRASSTGDPFANLPQALSENPTVPRAPVGDNFFDDATSLDNASAYPETAAGKVEVATQTSSDLGDMTPQGSVASAPAEFGAAYRGSSIPADFLDGTKASSSLDDISDLDFSGLQRQGSFAANSDGGVPTQPGRWPSEGAEPQLSDGDLSQLRKGLEDLGLGDDIADMTPEELRDFAAQGAVDDLLDLASQPSTRESVDFHNLERRLNALRNPDGAPAGADTLVGASDVSSSGEIPEMPSFAANPQTRASVIQDGVDADTLDSAFAKLNRGEPMTPAEADAHAQYSLKVVDEVKASNLDITVDMAIDDANYERQLGMLDDLDAIASKRDANVARLTGSANAARVNRDEVKAIMDNYSTTRADIEARQSQLRAEIASRNRT